MRFPGVVLRLPDWVEDTLADRVYPTVEDRMRLAVELSRLNVRHGTGGPFGVAIFDRETGELLASGVNLVVAANCSVFHAEMVAIMVAQQMVGGFDLGGEDRKPYELVASTELCAMCLGATPAPASGASYAAPGMKTRAPSASTKVRSLLSGHRRSRGVASP
jgi:tRNA(Arg) A34 adenosine deaminase TadA